MTIETIKFSQMNAGGDLPNNSKTPGLLASENVLFNNPWTFLASGSTADRPVPSVAVNGRLRFNTDALVYEYYDTLVSMWVELSGSGTGTVNPGTENSIAFYAANGTAVSPIFPNPLSVLVSDGTGLPSMSTTLPAGLTIPSATITSSTAALTSGQVVATPTNPTDIANKAYVDASFGAGVTSITGTTNQVIASAATGAVTLSLPQDIATGSTPTFAGLTLSSIPLNPASGGTGVNNGTHTLTLAGNLATVGAFSSTFTMTNTTAVTFPTSGTLATTSQLPTGAALTKTDDTNVTLTLGGSPTTALLNAASLTLGWTGVLSGTRGGTGVNNGASTITLGGSLTTSGAFASTFTMTGVTNVTFPTSGTLATTAGTVSSVSGTANQIGSTGGTTPVISIASNPILPGSAGFTLPSGNTAARAGGAGTMRFNSQTSVFEATIDGTNWATIETSAIGVTSITGTANQVIASASTGAITLSLPQSIATSSAVTFGSLAFSTTSGIIGTTTANSAAALSVGEYVFSQITFASRISITSSVQTNITSISLTAGDWDVWGNIGFSGAVSTTLADAVGGISQTSATLGDDSTFSSIVYSPSAAVFAVQTVDFCVPGFRISLSGTTTIYLVGLASFGVSTAAAFGAIYARRRR